MIPLNQKKKSIKNLNKEIPTYVIQFSGICERPEVMVPGCDFDRKGGPEPECNHGESPLSSPPAKLLLMVRHSEGFLQMVVFDRYL